MINVNVEANNVSLRIGDIVEYEYHDEVVMLLEYITFGMVIYDKYSDMPYRILDIISGEITSGYKKIEDMEEHIVKIYNGSYDLTIKQGGAAYGQFYQSCFLFTNTRG